MGPPHVQVRRSQTAAQPNVDAVGSVQWVEPYYNAAHTGFNRSETTLTRSNVSGLTQLWSFATGAQINNPIVVKGGVAYINSASGYLYAVNATTGASIWQYQTYEGASDQAPLIASGRVIVPCLVGGNNQQNAMCGINSSTGRRAWSYYVDCNCLPPAGISTGAVASGNTAVFDYANGSTSSSYLVAVNTQNGAVLWTGVTLPHGPLFTVSAIGASQVFYATGSGVCAASLSSGVQSWCTTVGSNASMAYANNVVYVDTYNNGVYALNASSGAQIWQYTPTAGNYSGYDDPPAIANGKVYVSGIGFNGNLYALKASTGAQIFNTSSDGSSANTTSSPSVANGVVYVECGSFVCAFNSATGALLYAPGSSGSQEVSPAVLNGVVYSACGPNNACAYGL